MSIVLIRGRITEDSAKAAINHPATIHALWAYGYALLICGLRASYMSPAN